MIADLKAKVAGLDKKRVYTAVAALLIAGAAGQFMQRSANEPAPRASGPVIAGAISMPPTPPQAARPAETRAEDLFATAPAVEETPSALPDADAVHVAEVTRGEGTPLFGIGDATPAQPEAVAIQADAEAEPAPVTATQPDRLAALDDAAQIAVPPVAPAPESRAAACDISFEAEPQAGALVAVTIEAPCNSGEDVDLAQAGLKFSEQLGPDGSLSIIVPAMEETAVFSARFADGTVRATEATVTDFADFERMAIVWQGATGLQLHALENGASYGEPGHIWAEHPGTTEAALEGAGGFISVLGSTSSGYAADVYTYPATLMQNGAEPDVSIEAQVMENTCGSKIEGMILRSNPFGAPNIEELSMAVPGCDAVGEYLVLKNLPQDLKLARN